MKRLLLILILSLSLQSWTKADDISEFEIEGMSVGDSALDFFSEKELLSTKSYLWADKKFASSNGWLKNQDSYESWQIFYKDRDEKYIIHYLSGLSKTENLEDCNKKKKKIVKEIKNLISNAQFVDLGKVSHPGDKTGESLAYKVRFDFNDGSNIMITCTDFTDKYIIKTGDLLTDNISVAILSSEFADFLNKAYK